MPGVLGAPHVIRCDWCAGFLRKNFGDQVKGANAMVRPLDPLCVTGTVLSCKADGNMVRII